MKGKYTGWSFKKPNSKTRHGIIGEMDPINNTYKIPTSGGASNHSYSENYIESLVEDGDWVLTPPKEKVKKLDKGMIRIETSTGYLDIPEEEVLKFNAEEFKYNTNKYPKWAQSISRMFPNFQKLDINNGWLIVLQSDDYYGTPEFKIITEKDKEFRILSITRDSIKQRGYNSDAVSDEVLAEVSFAIARDIVDSLDYNTLLQRRIVEVIPPLQIEPLNNQINEQENQQIEVNQPVDLPFPVNSGEGIRQAVAYGTFNAGTSGSYGHITQKQMEEAMSSILDESKKSVKKESKNPSPWTTATSNKFPY